MNIGKTPLWRLARQAAPQPSPTRFCDWDNVLLEELRAAAQLKDTDNLKHEIVCLAASLGIDLSSQMVRSSPG
jgi:hypothetical protein